jgi:2-hydroxychromene-2-carboxylate isomerase
MWRDIERRSRMYGLSAKVPVPYPIQEYDVANCVAVLGTIEGWGPRYVKEAYRRWMAEGHPPGLEPNVSFSLKAAGQDPARVMPLARTDNIAKAWANATDEVRALGIFGSPSFSVQGEVFWGDDRLEDAVHWLKHGSLAPL